MSFVHYDSNHQTMVKRGIAKYFYNRVKAICSKEDLKSEKERIVKTQKMDTR